MLAVASISLSCSTTAAPVSEFTSLDSCGGIDISVQAGSDYDVTFEGSPENVKYAGATVKDGAFDTPSPPTLALASASHSHSHSYELARARSLFRDALHPKRGI